MWRHILIWEFSALDIVIIPVNLLFEHGSTCCVWRDNAVFQGFRLCLSQPQEPELLCPHAHK